MPAYAGELAALATALCWTCSSLLFEGVTRRIGVFAVNFLKLPLALLLLAPPLLLVRGHLLPAAIPGSALAYLIPSALVGYVVGDLFLFEAFRTVGARISFVVMSLVPLLAALVAFLFFREALSALALLAMALAVGGILLVRLGKTGGGHAAHQAGFTRGLLFAAIAALCQALGFVLSRQGMLAGVDPFSASIVRLVAGMGGMVVAVTAARRWREVGAACRMSGVRLRLSGAVLCGPTLGVAFAMLALSRTASGIASTLIGLTPVLIIPVSIFVLRERVHAAEVAGALLAVGGVALFFLG